MAWAKVGAGRTAPTTVLIRALVRHGLKIAPGLALGLVAGAAWALQFGATGNGYTKQATCAAAQDQAQRIAAQRCKPQGVLRMTTTACMPRSTAYVTQRESYTAQIRATVECGSTSANQATNPAKSTGAAGVHTFVAKGDNPNSEIDACQAAIKDSRRQARAHCAKRGGIGDWKTAKCETEKHGSSASRYTLYISRVRTAVRCRN